MLPRSRQTGGLFQAYASYSKNLPDFLVPGLYARYPAKSLSSTSRCRSRIGSAPLSLPIEVNLRVVEPSPQKNSAVAKAEPRRTVEVEGPLGMRPALSFAFITVLSSTGKISLQLPPYMSIDHNETTRKVGLNILNRRERKQREMWGTCTVAPRENAH